jgi:hypothetical protein
VVLPRTASRDRVEKLAHRPIIPKSSRPIQHITGVSQPRR